MNTYYAYDRRGDNMKDDCTDLGSIDAANDADALDQAATFWPKEAAAGMLRVASWESNDIAAGAA